MSSALVSSSASASSVRWGIGDSLARRLVIRHLAGLRGGEIILHDPAGTACFGEPSELRAELRVHRPRMFRAAVLGGTLAVGEAYVRGDWDCDQLTQLLRIFVRNGDDANRLDAGLARIASWGSRLVHWLHRNSPAGSRTNIAAHYDLGNDFFRLWLDETLAYSSGIFLAPDATLHAASTEKFDRVCRKLDLRPTDELLEIGTGWGGFALHAAGQYGCRVTTTTISQEQLRVARERIAAAGLDSHVAVLQRDYRELTGQFHKLVSIEMIEAVGYRYLDQYFRQCGRLLRPDGTFVLQAIVMPERAYPRYLRSVDFIQRYVFPGGCLPSIEAILGAVGRSSDLRLVHAEDFAPHYAETLRRWRLEFQRQLPEVRRQGYSEQFIRLWNYYLCYCEAALAERYVGVVQLQFDKPRCQRDPIRLSNRAAASAVQPNSL